MKCIHWQIILINKTPFFVVWLPVKDAWCFHELKGAPTVLIWRPHWATERLREAPGAMLSLARLSEQKYPYSCYLQLYWLHGADLNKGMSHRWLVTKFHFSSRHKHEDLQLLQFHKILRPGFIGDSLPRINPALYLYVLRVPIQRTAVLANHCNQQ